MPQLDARDPESEHFLQLMAEQQLVRANIVPGVRTVLVVISSKGMVFDLESLRQKISLAYPEAAIFFQTVLGKPLGPSSPNKVDLLIDFTGPGQRQWIFRARKLRSLARVAVGRNAGFFRKSIYNKVFDDKALPVEKPLDVLSRERKVQREVLRLAGVAFVQAGDTPPDRGKVTPLELPPMLKL